MFRSEHLPKLIRRLNTAYFSFYENRKYDIRKAYGSEEIEGKFSQSGFYSYDFTFTKLEKILES